MSKILKTEVVVVGAGLAGVYTALKLLECNKNVVLIERDGPDTFGGQATESFGGVFIADSPWQRRLGIKDNPDLAYSDWCNFAEYDMGSTLQMQWAKNFVENSSRILFHDLGKYGVRYFPVVHWVERGLFVPGNSVPRFHMVWGTGKALMDSLKDALFGHHYFSKLKFFNHCKVQSLLSSAGKITGVEVFGETEKISFQVDAEHVVLATGGIGADLDLVRKNWHPDSNQPPEKLLIGCHRYNDGLMHKEVSKFNGQVKHLDKMWHYAAGIPHPRPRKENHGLSLVPTKSALWINGLGERIGPTPLVTAFDTRYLVSRICHQPKGFSWQILNQKIAYKELAVSGAEHNPEIRDKKLLAFLFSVLSGQKKLVDEFCRESEHFVVANTLDELIEKMAQINEGLVMNSKLLEKTIRDYDDMIDRGSSYFNDDQLRRIRQLRKYRGDKMRTCNFQKILDRKAGPLIAIKLNILVRKSLGGVVTDLQSRVLNEDNSPIPGLYAVGETAGFGGGGIHGKRALEGTFLGNCIFNAHAAAESIIGTQF